MVQFRLFFFTHTKNFVLIDTKLLTNSITSCIISMEGDYTMNPYYNRDYEWGEVDKILSKLKLV